MIASILALTPAAADVRAGRDSGSSDRSLVVHLLNRAAFGPRPGEVDRIASAGIDAWIARQLDPQSIDDGAVEARLKDFTTLTLSRDDLVAAWETQRRERRQTRTVSVTGDRDSSRMRNARLRPVAELSQARIIRAVESERQLEEVLVDFWMNHFNVFAAKGPGQALIIPYERDVIRPNIWGSFGDLLVATAQSPAMLVYLDNAQSVATLERRPTDSGRNLRRMSRRGGTRARSERIRNAGLNENYAREILELHTLGVDGGYSQRDVTELARLLTGWSVRRPGERNPFEFVFRRNLHDVGRKEILGIVIPPGGGLTEGEAVLRKLALHPSTALHLATKLAQRFVADDPPESLIDRVAERYLETGGDLRATVEAVLKSPEFRDPRYRGVKIKTPFEFAVSSLRALGGTTDGSAIALQLRQLGQPLYLCQEPTGYDETADRWVSGGALLNRMNLALALASGRLPGTVTPSIGATSLERIEEQLLPGRMSEATRLALAEQAGALTGPADAAQAVALILGSPDFQRQ